MGRYPFIVALNRFLSDIRAHYSEITMKDRERKLKHTAKVFGKLCREGKIDTTNPWKFTKKEIDAYLLWMREQGLDTATQAKNIGMLNHLLLWCKNPVIENMKKSRFTRFPKAMHKEIDPLPRGAVEYILDCSNQLVGWKGAVLRTALHLYAYTGLRPTELRTARIIDIDLATWTLVVSNPKGKNLYGRERRVKILPQCRETVIQYLQARKIYLQDNGIHSAEQLFPYLDRHRNVRYWSDAEWRKLKRDFERSANVRFKYKDFRASFAQMVIDSGGVLEHVSRALGHSTTATTELWYGRIRDADAWKGIEEALGTGAPKTPLVKVENPMCKKPQIEI
jgi:integrase